MEDKYNLNTNPNEGLQDIADIHEAAMNEDPHGLQQAEEPVVLDPNVIPGLGELKDLWVDDTVMNTLVPSRVSSV